MKASKRLSQSVHRISRVTCLVLLLLTVSTSPTAGSPAHSHFPIRVNVGSAPGTLDPQLVSYTTEVGHIRLIYEGLTRLDSSLATAAGAAQSWDFSDSGKTITFNLRPGLVYSDGSLLNAKRFENALLRALDPLLAAPYASILDDVVGAQAYRSASPSSAEPVLAALRAAVEIHALDGSDAACTAYDQASCQKLRVKLTSAVSAFPTILSMWIAYPVKEELITPGGSTWWQNVNNLIGNGPYIVRKLDFATTSLFVPNPAYWRGQPANPLQYSYITDSAAALAAFQANTLDINPVSGSAISTINADLVLKAQLHTYAGSCTISLFFDSSIAPFTDPKIRAAFAYSIDRQAYIDEVLSGGGVASLSWIPPGMPGYDGSETRWAYNTTLAQQALSDSAYHTAGSLPAITVNYSNTAANNTRWQWLKARWQSALGVSVNLVPVSSVTYPQPMLIAGWCGDFPDPSNYLSTYWKSTSTFAERFHYANASVDTLLNQADSEQNSTTRLNLYLQAQSLIVADVPAAFLYYSSSNFLVRPAVSGLIGTPMDATWMGDIDPLLASIASQDVFLPAVSR